MKHTLNFEKVSMFQYLQFWMFALVERVYLEVKYLFIEPSTTDINFPVPAGMGSVT